MTTQPTPIPPSRRTSTAARLGQYLPILTWGRAYSGAAFGEDGLAALIVTIMLIPQSLAYAMLAGLPPQMGLYASILPLVAYGVFGTSSALAVGPVAVISLMSAAAVGKLGLSDPALVAVAAITLAFLSGLILILMGVARLGFLANFLSHPVVSGFITASGILIAFSQLRHILGVSGGGETLPDIGGALWSGIMAGGMNGPTVIIGAASLAFLFWSRRFMKPALSRIGVRGPLANILTKAGPAFAVVFAILATRAFDLDQRGVAIVGVVPAGLPMLALPSFSPELWRELALSAVLISVIGFVESVSVAQTLAAKRRERIRPDQELLALGASNIAAALGGGYAVTGGFARSVVNFDAGARTPAAGMFTAIGIALAAAFLTPWLYYLPTAVLAATIIVAVLSLVDVGVLRRTWRYDRADFVAVATTILATLMMGVEIGVSTGVILSIGMHLFRSSRPHMAEVGLVPGTEHFRNINRHKVVTAPHLLQLRIDEGLYFANARYLEDYLVERVVEDCPITDVVLMCSAVNMIDMSALESLEAINHRLKDMGVRLHMSEVKGPVMDRLNRSDFIRDLTGEVYLSAYAAAKDLGGV